MAQVIKRGDSELYLAAIPFEVKAVEGESRVLRFIGSDETPDRDNDIIEVNGWDLANYRKNPVFLWAHDYRFPPIGRGKKVAKEDGKLVFDIEFPAEGIFPFADLIFNLYKGKFLRATSVGFIPKKHETRDDDDVKDLPEWRRGRRYKKQELLELSAVPVPANPNALQLAMEKGFVTEEQAEAVTDWLNGKIGCPTKACKAIEGVWKAESVSESALTAEVDNNKGIVTVGIGNGQTRAFTLELLKSIDVDLVNSYKNHSDELLKLNQYVSENRDDIGAPGESVVDSVIRYLKDQQKSPVVELTDELKTILEQLKQAALGGKQPDAPQGDDIDLDAIEVQTATPDGEELDIEPEALKQLISDAVKEELDKARGKVS